MIRVLPGAIVLALVCLPASAQTRASAQTNVLILVADDVGLDAVACYAEGTLPASTPNIDRLASHGVLFRNA